MGLFFIYFDQPAEVIVKMPLKKGRTCFWVLNYLKTAENFKPFDVLFNLKIEKKFNLYCFQGLCLELRF